MKIRDIGVIVAALAAGYAGGKLSSGKSVQASSPVPISASKFTLVNGAGSAVAVLEPGPGGSARLIFMAGGRTVLALATSPDGFPFLAMEGRDGKDRVRIGLALSDKPYLAMSDDRWQSRVALGSLPPDTVPYPPDWDSWGLVFRGFGSEMPVAGIGMQKIGGRPLEGFLSVSGKAIK